MASDSETRKWNDELGAPRPRREASPLGWEHLCTSQAKAALRVMRILRPIAKEVEGINKDWKHGKLPALDDHRSSRIVFLHGEAGNGKTTVYTSLKKLVSDTTDQDDGGPNHASSKGEELRKEGRWLANLLRSRVVWLEPLDLEPTAGSQNFLAAVMARIDGAIGDHGVHTAEPRTPGLLDAKSRYDEALMSLQRLQSDLALSWDGNLPARAAQVDPDVFSVEVLRAELARLSVNRKLQEALILLSKHVFSANGTKDPLFVLPIDDVYLHPATTLELLRLLRMISAPHLFVLLMGDYDTIEELFYQKSLGDLVALAGGDVLRHARGQYLDLSARARSLTESALRKLLPPTQRIDVEHLEIDEALRFLPAGSRDRKPTLRKLLEATELKNGPGEVAGPPLRNWSAMLLARWEREHKASDEDEGLRPKYPYSGSKLLEAPARHIHDLWSALYERTTPQLRLAGEELLRALYEQNRVRGKGRERFERAILRAGGVSSVSSVFNSYRLDTDAFVATFGVNELLEARHKESGWRVRKLNDWSLSVKGHGRKQREAQDPPSKAARPLDFPPRVLAWFAMLHDLLLSETSQGSSGLVGGGSLVDRDEFRDTWKQIVINADKTRQNPLPLPRWKTFWEFELLLDAWNDGVDELRKLDKLDAEEWISAIAFRFFEAVYNIFTWKSGEASSSAAEKGPSLKTLGSVNEQAWSELMGKLAAHVKPGDAPGDEAMSTWVRELSETAPFKWPSPVKKHLMKLSEEPTRTASPAADMAPDPKPQP